MKVSFAVGEVGLLLFVEDEEGEEEGLSQRLGRQSRASEPQVWGSVWRAWTLMLIAVLGGSACVLSPRARLWGWKPVDFGMKTMEPYRRRVSY